MLFKDRHFASKKHINHNLEEQARQLYEYWFVQFDFPNEFNRPYMSEGGSISESNGVRYPSGWEIQTVNDISKSQRGVTYDKSDLLNQGVLVLRGNNIDKSHLKYDSNTAFVPESLVLASQKIKRGDIIMTMSSGSKEHIGKCMLFNYDSSHTFGAFLNRFRASSDLYEYLFLFMTSSFFKAKIKSICNGTGINNLTVDNFNEIYLPIPKESILQQFNKIIKPIFEQIGKNEQQVFKLEFEKAQILPLIITGQVFVSSLNYDLSQMR